MVTAKQIKELPKGDFAVMTPNMKKPYQKVLKQLRPHTKESPSVVGTLEEIIQEYVKIRDKKSNLVYARREVLLFKIEMLRRLMRNKLYYFTQIFPQDPTGEITRILRNGKTAINGKAATGE